MGKGSGTGPTPTIEAVSIGIVDGVAVAAFTDLRARFGAGSLVDASFRFRLLFAVVVGWFR